MGITTAYRFVDETEVVRVPNRGRWDKLSPDEVFRGLHDPERRRMGGGAQDPDSAAGVFDHRERVHPRPRWGHCLEEVSSQQGVRLGAGPVEA
ncbi:hypothetical protein GCM10009646_67730 [Streptomyces aureus]